MATDKRSRPRSARAVQHMPNRELAEHTAILESELLRTFNQSQNLSIPLLRRLGHVRSVNQTMKMLGYCYTELLRRAEVGLLATGEGN